MTPKNKTEIRHKFVLLRKLISVLVLFWVPFGEPLVPHGDPTGALVPLQESTARARRPPITNYKLQATTHELPNTNCLTSKRKSVTTHRHIQKKPHLTNYHRNKSATKTTTPHSNSNMSSTITATHPLLTYDLDRTPKQFGS